MHGMQNIKKKVYMCPWRDEGQYVLIVLLQFL